MHLTAAHAEATRLGAGHFVGARGGVRLAGLCRKNQSGFTLIELITVMIIVGILAVAVLPRFMDNNSFEARGAADQVAAALRYGQKVAIAQQRNISVNISSAAGSSCSAVLAGTAVNCAIANSVGVTPVTVVFNPLGQRVPNSPAISIPVGTTTIIIEAETGYVH